MNERASAGAPERESGPGSGRTTEAVRGEAGAGAGAPSRLASRSLSGAADQPLKVASAKHQISPPTADDDSFEQRATRCSANITSRARGCWPQPKGLRTIVVVPVPVRSAVGVVRCRTFASVDWPQRLSVWPPNPPFVERVLRLRHGCLSQSMLLVNSAVVVEEELRVRAGGGEAVRPLQVHPSVGVAAVAGSGRVQCMPPFGVCAGGKKGLRSRRNGILRIIGDFRTGSASYFSHQAGENP